MKGRFLLLAVIAPAPLVAQGTRSATSLRVIDAQGTDVVVANAD